MQTAPASDIRPAVTLLEKTPLLLETLLRGVTLGLCQWKPAPDRWSIAEVLAHLADLEQVYGARVRRLLAEDTPALQRYDQAGASAAGDYSRGSALEHLARFTATLGAITLSQTLHEWASHDLGRLRQIAELYRAHAFHPHSDPFQKYSTPKP